MELDYYLDSGVRLSRLIGLSVSDATGCADDRIADVVAGSDGRVHELTRLTAHGTYSTRIEDTRVRWRAGRLLELRSAPSTRRRRRDGAREGVVETAAVCQHRHRTHHGSERVERPGNRGLERAGRAGPVLDGGSAS